MQHSDFARDPSAKDTLAVLDPRIRFLTALSDNDDDYCLSWGAVPAGVVVPSKTSPEPSVTQRFSHRDIGRPFGLGRRPADAGRFSALGRRRARLRLLAWQSGGQRGGRYYARLTERRDEPHYNRNATSGS